MTFNIWGVLMFVKLRFLRKVNFYFLIAVALVGCMPVAELLPDTSERECTGHAIEVITHEYPGVRSPSAFEVLVHSLSTMGVAAENEVRLGRTEEAIPVLDPIELAETSLINFERSTLKLFEQAQKTYLNTEINPLCYIDEIHFKPSFDPDLGAAEINELSLKFMSGSVRVEEVVAAFPKLFRYEEIDGANTLTIQFPLLHSYGSGFGHYHHFIGEMPDSLIVTALFHVYRKVKIAQLMEAAPAEAFELEEQIEAIIGDLAFLLAEDPVDGVVFYRDGGINLSSEDGVYSLTEAPYLPVLLKKDPEIAFDFLSALHLVYGANSYDLSWINRIQSLINTLDQTKRMVASLEISILPTQTHFIEFFEDGDEPAERYLQNYHLHSFGSMDLVDLTGIEGEMLANWRISTRENVSSERNFLKADIKIHSHEMGSSFIESTRRIENWSLHESSGLDITVLHENYNPSLKLVSHQKENEAWLFEPNIYWIEDEAFVIGHQFLAEVYTRELDGGERTEFGQLLSHAWPINEGHPLHDYLGSNLKILGKPFIDARGFIFSVRNTGEGFDIYYWDENPESQPHLIAILSKKFERVLRIEETGANNLSFLTEVREPHFAQGQTTPHYQGRNLHKEGTHLTHFAIQFHPELIAGEAFVEQMPYEVFDNQYFTMRLPFLGISTGNLTRWHSNTDSNGLDIRQAFQQDNQFYYILENGFLITLKKNQLSLVTDAVTNRPFNGQKDILDFADDWEAISWGLATADNFSLGPVDWLGRDSDAGYLTLAHYYTELLPTPDSDTEWYQQKWWLRYDATTSGQVQIGISNFENSDRY